MPDDSRGKHDDGKLLYCSFCGKSQHEVRKLIAGPSVFVWPSQKEATAGTRKQRAATTRSRQGFPCRARFSVMAGSLLLV